MVTLTFPNCDQNERLLRDRPQLPAGMLLLLAGRSPFPPFWKAASLFQSSIPIINLCNGLCAQSRKIVQDSSVGVLSACLFDTGCFNYEANKGFEKRESGCPMISFSSPHFPQFCMKKKIGRQCFKGRSSGSWAGGFNARARHSPSCLLRCIAVSFEILTIRVLKYHANPVHILTNKCQAL